MLDRALSTGWITAKISEIAIKGQQRKPDSDEQFDYIDIGSIDRNLKMISEPQSVIGKEAPSRARKVIEAGDVLVSLTRPNLNAVALVGQKYDNQIASTGFEVIKPVGVDSRYIFALVRSKNFIDKISGVVQGALYPAAKSSDVQNFEFPLPPLAEQKVIADKLDTLLAQVDSTKARLERIPEILKRFRQSVLAAAVSGRLTEEWRDSNSALFPYESRQLSEIILEMRNGLSPKPNEDSRGAPILRISSLRPFLIDQRDIRHLEVSDKHKELYSLKTDDLLFTRYNGSIEFVGVCARVKRLEHHVLLYPDKLIRVRVDKGQVIPEFIELFSASQEAREYIHSLVKSTSGQKGISGKDLKLMKIRLPSISEQTEIVRRVDQLFAYADTVERQVNSALKRVNQLTQSILAKAFRGELTAQWREENPELISGDNSAEALLAHIKAERAAQAPKKRTRKKATP